jgi:bifunctional DNA-binding transcriptional regulator/antitoxin component of YhaV-PrlF toxin-antitoxin module
MSKIVPQQRGITRPIDRAGRVSIPREMYKALGIKLGDPVDILSGVDDNGNSIITVKKSSIHCPNCIAKLTPENTVELDRISLCTDCVAAIQKKAVPLSQ